jgi:hypothetical protein
MLLSPWFIVISSGRRLTLLASKLSADGFGNPPNAGIERLAAVRSVVVGRTRSLPFLFLCHADAPSSGSVGWKQRGNGQRKSEIQAIDLRRRNACRRRGPSALTPRKTPAGPATSGQGREPASRAREQREPLPDGAGPAPWRKAGGDTGHHHSPGPRFLPKPHSMPPALRMMHSTRPARRNTSSWRTWEWT